MKRIVILFLFSCLCLSSFGQGVSKGEKQLHIGAGLGNAQLPYGFRVVVPPIQVSYGVALADNFVLSGFVAYANTRYDYEDYLYSRYPVWSGGNVHYRWTTNDILFGVEGRYYFGEVLNLSGRFNPYAKVMVGYHSIALKKEAIKAYSDIDPILRPLPMGGTFAGIAIGATYNVSDKIAVFGELGYAISLLQLGLVIKM